MPGRSVILIYDCNLWLNDIDEVLEKIFDIKRLAGKSVLITGCTGLICSAVVDMLIRFNEKYDDKYKSPVTILAAGRAESKVRQRFGHYLDKKYFRYIKYDANKNVFNLDTAVDYIIHGASNAYPYMIFKEPVETMMSNFIGMKALLDYAKNKSVNCVLYISSSEVYGEKRGRQPYTENEYGFIDLLNSRNSYSIGKRAVETLCASYYSEYGVNSVIVRPGHIYGPTADPCDNRVSSAWAYKAAKGEDIVMMSDGAQLRSYCYCLDCASAILTVLLKGESVRAYNISNPASIISIRDMAEILTKVAGVKLIQQKPSDEERKKFNPMNNSSLNSSSLQSLGWNGLFNAMRGFSHTVNILKTIK